MGKKTDMEKCCVYKRRGDRCEIKCRLGLWSVEGPYGIQLINEADHYFQQYKADGEYDELLNTQQSNQPDAKSSAAYPYRYTSMKNYKVIQISKKEAIPWMTRKHYARKKPMIKYAFGIYRDMTLCGVCSFGLSGNMNNNSLGKYDMLELNRLCINDNEMKNLASFFMGKIFRLLPKPIALISYADTEMNHVGYIYQATNWLYTGIDGGAELYCKDGIEMHSKSFSDRFGTRSKEFAKSKGYIIKKTTGKHRYFYFLGTKTQKKEMFESLKYKILPYPKGESRRYDAGKKIETQRVLFI